MSGPPGHLETVDAAQFRLGMRRLGGAVTLITTMHDGVRHGLTASAVCSLSSDPPSLLVCVNKEASAHDPLGAAQVFAVNVLAHEQTDLAMLFSSSKMIEQRFASGSWVTGATGAPLLEGALVSFDCVVEQHVSKSTHTIFIGEVKEVRLGADPQALLYLDGRFGTFGPAAS